MLTLTPVVCVCGAIVVSDILTTYLDLRIPSWTRGEDPDVVVNEVMSSRQRRSTNTPQETTGITLLFHILCASISSILILQFQVLTVGIFNVAAKAFVVITFAVYLALFVRHSTYVTSTAYSSPSVVLASRLADGSQYIIDDYREAYYWLRMNTPDEARVMSWSVIPTYYWDGI